MGGDTLTTTTTTAQGLHPCPQHSGLEGPGPGPWDPQQVLGNWTAARTADTVYYSMHDLAAAWHASLVTLTAMHTFHKWKRIHPTFKPRLAGSLWTALGPRHVTALLDTSATHCFICARSLRRSTCAPQISWAPHRSQPRQQGGR